MGHCRSSSPLKTLPNIFPNYLGSESNDLMNECQHLFDPLFSWPRLTSLCTVVRSAGHCYGYNVEAAITLSYLLGVIHLDVLENARQECIMFSVEEGLNISLFISLGRTVMGFCGQQKNLNV